jgi:sirohydrochlorin cobaltochelatase
MPFMLVTGDHVINDMAGDKGSSWKNTLIKGGFEVEVNMLGLGQNKKIQDIFISHLKTIIENN